MDFTIGGHDNAEERPALAESLYTAFSSRQFVIKRGNLAFEPNVVYFSGFNPFVGFGDEINSWTMAVDLTRSPTGSKSPPKVDTADLYGAVRRRLLWLPVGDATYKDKVFVDGRRLRNEALYLPDAFQRPFATLPEEVITRMQGQSELHARHYACYSISGWSGQTVSTSLLRFVSNREFCIVEKKAYYLAPINDLALRKQWSFLTTLGARRISPALLTGALAAPIHIITSPFLFFSALPFLSANCQPSGIVRRRIQKKDILYDYGLTETFRESAADYDFHYGEFQLADVLANFRMVDQVVIDTLVAYFDARGVDTSDIRQTKQAILNQGVIISGGSLRARNLAVGKGAAAGKGVAISSRSL